MKKTRIALAIATAALSSTPVFATNGDVLIGLGAQSRALGGTGTAAFYGSENALSNPGMLGKSVGTEFTIGGTLFKPNVKATTDVASMTGQPVSQTSDNDTNVIPEVSLSTRLSENLTFGLGIFGSAGMGVDYRDNAGTNGITAAAGQNGDGTALFNGYSNLQLMKFAPTLAYNSNNYGIGFAPVIQYGALDINYKASSINPATYANQGTSNVGNGMSTDLGFGYNLGGYFDITNDLTLALAYQSAISMKYKNQISTAATGFGLTMSDDLEQPAEMKVGVAYTMGSLMFTGDYKNIAWGSAKGYKDFGWEDQNVFGLGVKYSGNGYWAGAGYNYGSDPIKVLDESKTAAQGGYNNQATNLFNNHFFPGVVEQHFTFGGGYSLTKNIAIDGAVVYAPQVSKTINTGAVGGGMAYNAAVAGGSTQVAAAPYLSNPANASTHTVDHSQIGYTVSLRMNF
ncbi:OmpP1/FadL family transporter [Thiosulfativibrio zosterae]|uniref:Aromatic hydrocarbon degradation protein n=1 Tax=Thiosulfativibrio zosterae TaxID=2675053 RepID=A0A6F8PL93_9GAMM|nr:outer membrane protein transport protein [Thiosulfativibrio zosterae]BBP42872.1 hypothetical protein THMIRHAT_06180 [Thiosulfativibrio zosterae]